MFTHLLLLSIAVPLAAAAVISTGLPTRVAKAVAALGFLAPALIALHVWYHFAEAAQKQGYAFLISYQTGVQHLGIKLTLGLNGIATPRTAERTARSIALVAFGSADTVWDGPRTAPAPAPSTDCAVPERLRRGIQTIRCLLSALVHTRLRLP